VLGDELWAYIPKCQLPHLKMLAQTSYAGSNHLNFVDLKPRVFDAKIFASSGVHPNGWGTILVCGMNLGGKPITVSDPAFAGGAQTFVSSYAAFDITVPGSPAFLWEKSFPNMGFTTTTPAVVKVKDSWFLVIGSGPTSEDGTSTQNGRVFIINLATGALLQTFVTTETNAFMNSPVALDKNMNYNVAAIYVGASYQSGSTWLGKAYKIAVPQLNTSGDYDPFCIDCYDDNPLNWRWQPLFESPAPFSAPFTLSVDHRDNAWVFIGTGRYIASADRLSGDQQYLFGIKDPFYNRRGTVQGDAFTPGCFQDYDATGCTITMADVFNANPYRMSAGGTVEIKSGYTDTLGLEGKNFDEFLAAGVKKKSTGSNPMEIYQGWYRNLPVPPESCPCVCTATGCSSATPCLSDLSCPAPCSRYACTSSERVVNKPAAFGGIALFPTFTPVSDLCRFGGSSKLYGLYFESGTSYKRTVFRGADNTDAIQDVVSLGAGLASSPAIHAGKQQGQSGTALSQLSTGQIVQVEVVPAFTVKSGTQYWRESR
jgi:type IV pilus assembly protein PilY1